MNKQEEILAEIEECILPNPATKTYVTRNVAKEIVKDIASKLNKQGVVMKVRKKAPQYMRDEGFETVTIFEPLVEE